VAAAHIESSEAFCRTYTYIRMKCSIFIVLHALLRKTGNSSTQMVAGN